MQYCAEDGYDRPVTALEPNKLTPVASVVGRRHPVLEGNTTAQCTGLVSEHRHVVPRVIHGPFSAEVGWTPFDHPVVLAELNAISIGDDLDRAPDGSAMTK